MDVLVAEAIVKNSLKENAVSKTTDRMVKEINRVKELKKAEDDSNVDYEVWACLNACGHLPVDKFFRRDDVFEAYESIMDKIEHNPDFNEDYAEKMLYKGLLKCDPEPDMNIVNDEVNEEWDI